MWDEFTIGSLITGYYSGWFVLTSIEFRNKNDPDYEADYEGEDPDYNLAPLFYMVKVADKNGRPVNSNREYSCDASYCKKVTQEMILKMFDAEVDIAAAKRNYLNSYV